MPRPSHSGPDASRCTDDLLYRIDGMTCGHCKTSVSSEVTKVAGVASVDVDLETKLMRVRGTAIDGAAVVAAVDEAGYDAVAA